VRVGKRERTEDPVAPPSAKRSRLMKNQNHSLVSLPDLPFHSLIFFLGERDRVFLKCSCRALKEKIEQVEAQDMESAHRILAQGDVCAFLRSVSPTFPTSVSGRREVFHVLNHVDKITRFVMPFFSNAVQMALGPIPSDIAYRPDIVFRVITAADNRNTILLNGPYSHLNIDMALESEEAMRSAVQDLRAYFSVRGNKTMLLTSCRPEKLTAFSVGSMIALDLRGGVGNIDVAKMPE